LHKAQIVCIGQAVVDCITIGITYNGESRKSARAQTITLNAGGDALNESIVLSHLGWKVRTLCITGEDLAGDVIRSSLEKAGADTSGIRREASIPTVVADIIVETDGSRRSINSRAIGLGGLHVDPGLIGTPRLVSLASLFRAPLDDPEAVLELARAAKKAGAILCADTKIPVYKKIALSDFAPALSLVDYIFPNETEAAYYSGRSLTGQETEKDFEEMADTFLSAGAKNVVIKAGPGGCYYKGQEGSFSMPALPVKAVDTTGAGDNFVSGFITGLLEGDGAGKACRLGLACAAVSIGSVGTTAGVDSRDRVRALYDTYFR